MSDLNKVDLGSIQIHKKVLADIAATSINEIEGVRLIPADFKNYIFDVFGKSFPPGITVSVEKNGQVSIEIKILVRYGLNIPDLARHVQDVIRSAVEKTADISLKDINVNIAGIERVGI